jgi:CubicO group peptidase (beta-lactamase class C family)
MKQMKQMITVLSLLLFITATGNSQNLNGLDGIDSFIDSTMKRWSVPGVAIAVIKDGMVIYEKGYGYRNLKTKEKVTTQTLFSIASSSKAFTATLAAMVVRHARHCRRGGTAG